jgi:hypothetical protein
LGHKRTLGLPRAMSALPPKGDIKRLSAHALLSVFPTVYGQSATLQCRRAKEIGATATPQGEIVDPAIDNALQANLKALQDKADQLIDNQKAQIQSLAAELAQPKAAVQPKTSLPAKSLISQLRAATGS